MTTRATPVVLHLWLGGVAACGGPPATDDATATVGTSAASADTTSDPGSTAGPDDGSTGVGTTADPTLASATDTTDDTTGAPTLPPAIGLVQYNPDVHFGDDAFNVASLTMWAEAAVAQGAKIIVFPEGSTYGYASASEVWCAPGMATFQGRTCRDVSTVAEPLPGGPSTAYWTAFAEQHDVAVIFHVPEVDGGTYYNAVGVVGPDGYVTRYRKRSLYYVDAAYATAGDAPTVIDTPWGRFGLMICLDGTYDGGYYDEYLAQSVDGIIIAMDWDDDPDGDAAAITWFRDRADANGVRIYAADVSTWDGTGLYLPGDVPRERNGLPAVAVGTDGISIHPLGP